MLKQNLQQKLIQKLSPQQIQMIKLLEIPTIELEQRIKKELEENPLLEEGEEENFDEHLSEVDDDADVDDDDFANDEAEAEFKEDKDDTFDKKDKDQNEFTFEDYLNEEDEIPGYKLSVNNISKDDKHEEIPFSVGDSFAEFLEGQLGLRTLTERQQMLASYIIGNIDEDGYIRRKLENIVDDLAFSQNISTTDDELLEILHIIQDFDPPGVGARDLQECLLLQLERKDQTLLELQLAWKILKYHFEEFSKRHFDKIIGRLDITEEEMKLAVDEILKLNPKPGSVHSDSQNKSAEHVTPDFVLENREGDLVLSLNSKNVPELHISQSYNDLINTYARAQGARKKQDKEAVTFVRQKLDSARWFIDALRQRQNTLLLTMNAIIEYQREYFKEGDESLLHPMILKDIADRTGLDISTISRVANSKYIQTHFGIYPLKFFFSEGMQTDSGEEVSTREIKKILQDCIESEEKRKPLTDDQLADILKVKGYPIARRTIAKYREQLNISVARLRKEL